MLVLWAYHLLRPPGHWWATVQIKCYERLCGWTTADGQMENITDQCGSSAYCCGRCNKQEKKIKLDSNYWKKSPASPVWLLVFRVISFPVLLKAVSCVSVTHKLLTHSPHPPPSGVLTLWHQLPSMLSRWWIAPTVGAQAHYRLTFSLSGLFHSVSTRKRIDGVERTLLLIAAVCTQWAHL